MRLRKAKEITLTKIETHPFITIVKSVDSPRTLTLTVPVSTPEGFLSVTVYLPVSSRLALATASITVSSVNCKV